MLINSLLFFFQSVFKSFYEKSYILKKIDGLIGLNIFLVIASSIFAYSDSIGYFAIFAIILTIIKLLTKNGEKFELTNADKFLLLYFTIILISVAGSSLFSLSLKGFFKTFIYFGFYVSVVHYLKNNKAKIKYILIVLATCVSLEAIVAFMQNFASVAEISGWQDTSRLNPEEIMTRVYGTLKPYNPNLFGGYLLATLPSFLALFFVSKKYRICSLIFGLAGLYSLLLTGCRGAYIGLFFELLILITLVFYFMPIKLRKLYSMLVGGVICASIFLITTTSALRARIFSIFAMRNDSSNSFRFNVYNSCLEMFKDNWLLGIGCGNQNFREIYGLYMKTGFDALSAYNIYLEIAVESGIFALVAFLAYVYVKLKNAYKYIFQSNVLTVEKVYVVTAVISIIGILIHGIVDTVFFRPQIQFVFWTMMAIIRVLVFPPKFVTIINKNVF